jgi:hypothetical protein
MTENNYLTQTQLAERWRSEGIGPIYMKMMGRERHACSTSQTLRRIPLAGVLLSANRRGDR